MLLVASRPQRFGTAPRHLAAFQSLLSLHLSAAANADALLFTDWEQNEVPKTRSEQPTA